MTIINERDAQEIRQHLAASITRPVQLALFVSAQNCEYCDITHELGARYHVMGVPRTMIDELVSVEGAAPEGQLLGKLIDAQRMATLVG